MTWVLKITEKIYFAEKYLVGLLIERLPRKNGKS